MQQGQPARQVQRVRPDLQVLREARALLALADQPVLSARRARRVRLVRLVRLAQPVPLGQLDLQVLLDHKD